MVEGDECFAAQTGPLIGARTIGKITAGLKDGKAKFGSRPVHHPSSCAVSRVRRARPSCKWADILIGSCKGQAAGAAFAAPTRFSHC